MATSPLILLLAGGQSQRMGTDKALIKLGKQTLIDHVLAKARKYADDIIISCNSDDPSYQKLGFPLIADEERFQGMGPLSGMTTGLALAKTKKRENIITLAVDTPFFPDVLFERFQTIHLETPQIPLLAESLGRLHPTFCLWPVSLLEAMQYYLSTSPKKSILSFALQHNYKPVIFETNNGIDPFFNINDSDDLAVAQAILKT